MTPTERDAAITWFIGRFLHSKFDVSHAMRRAGLEEIPSQKEWTRQKWRFPHLDFEYLDARDRLAIIPKKEQAAWAEGIIWRDERGDFQFTTGKVNFSATVEQPKG